MNNIERIFSESVGPEDFAEKYLDYLTALFRKLDKNKIAQFIYELEDAYEKGNTIFIAGNGGSAATASHMANDFGMDVLKKSGSDKAFKALSLTDNTSLITAIANDDGYENIFVNQLKIHYRDGDKLIVISASGNSPNVVAAANWVKSKGGKVLGLTGFDGGKLKDICDVVIHVDTKRGEYGPVEDIHTIIDHLVANWLQYKLGKIFSSTYKKKEMEQNAK
ncbi:MAG: SIS domain-containing protein [Syntrophorhabdaceae bacterium]|nr:SIS domain-containing protein [Syntrophorhabdaceae bacterium]